MIMKVHEEVAREVRVLGCVGREYIAGAAHGAECAEE
jgi:hypothetical protein